MQCFHWDIHQYACNSNTKNILRSFWPRQGPFSKTFFTTLGAAILKNTLLYMSVKIIKHYNTNYN